jgi:hypothetical protein
LASRPYLIINVMSVRFTADTIAASSADFSAMNHHSSASSPSGRQAYLGDDSFNSMGSSNTARTQTLIDNGSQKQHHQGRLMEGTPDAIASSMSSNFNSNNNHIPNNNTSQAAAAAASAHLLNASAQDLFSQFHEALALEPKYQPNLFLPQQSNVSNETVTAPLILCSLELRVNAKVSTTPATYLILSLLSFILRTVK